MFSEIFPFSALSFTLDKSNQAHKAMKLHFSKNGLISGDVCTSLSARLNHTQMNSEIFQKRATLKIFKLMLTPSLHICAWYKNYKWLSEGTSVESFCGEKRYSDRHRAPNLPPCLSANGLDKYFTMFPLSEVKGLWGSPGDDWLLHKRASYSVSEQKIAHYIVLYGVA